jgi:ankyrin repeat protein
MWSGIMKRLKRNAFAFALTFGLSLAVSGVYPIARKFISWHVQYQLCHAAAEGKTTRVKLLLLTGASPAGSNAIYSPLHFAARYGQTETARMLLDAGANVNSMGTWQQTPLMEAVHSRSENTIGLLLARGASVYVQDVNSGTALWHATKIRNARVVQLLMDYGGRNCTDAESALSDAVENGDGETVRALLKGGIDPRDVTATPLVLPLTRVAALNRQPEIVKMLKAAGAR